MERFLLFFKENLHHKTHQIRKIDLRYKEAFAVSWENTFSVN